MLMVKIYLTYLGIVKSDILSPRNVILSRGGDFHSMDYRYGGNIGNN